MGTAYKIFVIAFVIGGLAFPRIGDNNPRVAEKKDNIKHCWMKDQYKDDGNNKLDRKRSHKRRRKIRKPVKGLR